MAPRSATGDHVDRTPTQGYEARRDAAMAASAKSLAAGVMPVGGSLLYRG
jgi:hypothetical protein